MKDLIIKCGGEIIRFMDKDEDTFCIIMLYQNVKMKNLEILQSGCKNIRY